ncbi:MAG: retroviral-like aspartic protease family protein [Candidatus Helarchaeota archaeon]
MPSGLPSCWFDRRGHGYFSAYLYIPSFNRIRRIDFLIDTGADSTILNSRDAFDLGLKPEEHTSNRAFGFGGEFELYTVTNTEILFIFLWDNNNIQYINLNKIEFLPPNPDSELIFDSVLGLDIINQFDLHFCFRARRLILKK